MKRCPACGRELDERLMNCPACGGRWAADGGFSPAPSAYAAPSTTEDDVIAGRKRRLWLILALSVAIDMLAMVGLVLYFALR